MENELIVAEKIDPIIIFTGDGMPKILKEIEEKALAYCSTLSEETAVGRKEIASLAYKVAQSKTLIDDMGIVVADDSKKKVKLIDGNRKLARDFLDDLKKKVRKPLTDWEEYEASQKAEAERKRQEQAQERVNKIMSFGVILPFAEALEISQGDFNARLIIAEDEYKKEQASLAEEKRLADEKSATEKKARDEEAARLAAERKKLDEERAEQDRKQKEQAAILKDEQDKLAAERKAIEDEKRERDRLSELEKAKKEAAEKVIIETAEKAEREAKAKAEAEQKAKDEAVRQEALRTDKDKLKSFAISLMAQEGPQLNSDEAKAILYEAIKRILNVHKFIINATKEL